VSTTTVQPSNQPTRRGFIRLPATVGTAPLAAVGLVVLGACLWGVDGPFRSTLTNHGWSATTIVLYEHAILTLCVLPILLREGRRLRDLTWQGWLSALGVAWGASAFATLAFTQGLIESFAGGNPNVVFLLQKTQPLWAVGVAMLVVREFPLQRYAFLLVTCLLGAYLLSFGWMGPTRAFHGAQGRAAGYALLAAALWGAGTALGRRALREVGPQLLTATRFSLALPLLFVIALWRDALTPATAASGDWPRLIFIALVPGFIAMMLYYRGLERTPAPIATLAELAFPTTALIVNYVWLNAGIRPIQLLGFAIIWCSIAALHWAPIRLEARSVRFLPRTAET
jgi:drug/metabolite transporter (DMT)-like permease